jgi:hypothetical protein
MGDELPQDFLKWAREQEAEAARAAEREDKARRILVPLQKNLFHHAIKAAGEWATNKGISQWFEIHDGDESSELDPIIALLPDRGREGVCHREYMVASFRIPSKLLNCMRITIDLLRSGDYFRFYYNSNILKHVGADPDITRQLRIVDIDKPDMESLSTKFNDIIFDLINLFLKETKK